MSEDYVDDVEEAIDEEPIRVLSDEASIKVIPEPDGIKRKKIKRVEYRRFSRYARVTHVILFTSVFNQFITGIPLKFRNAEWGQFMINDLFGGVYNAGLMHRIGGAGMWTAAILHFAFLFWYILGKKGPIYGPDTILFKVKDAKDLYGHFKYALGKGPEPRFEKFTYLEKFDWFAVGWGLIIIGVTGILLWFKESFQFLPGQTLNVAIILHSEEALLALGFLLIVHFYGAHFKPGSFPFNPAMFKGTETEEIFKHERAAEWERLNREDPQQLEDRKIVRYVDEEEEQ